MSLFSALVRTAVNVAILPVAVTVDIAGGWTNRITGGTTFTEDALKKLKEEAEP